MKSDGLVTFSAPDHCAFKPKLKVAYRLETELFSVYPWVSGIDHVRLAGLTIVAGRRVAVAERILDQGMTLKRPYEE